MMQFDSYKFDNVIFWGYIILLLVGGLIGFFKANSKVSLLTSAVAAGMLVLTHIGIFEASFGRKLADIIMVALLIVFAIRLTKTKKFMPNGMMLILTIIVLALLNLNHTW
jgi:uncharacterized membrane protein (UPF0136 family)